MLEEILPKRRTVQNFVVEPSGIRKRGGDATLLLVINGHDDLVDFIMPEGTDSEEWCLLVDTNREENDADGVFSSGDKFDVTGRSLLLFVLQAGRILRRVPPTDKVQLVPDPKLPCRFSTTSSRKMAC